MDNLSVGDIVILTKNIYDYGDDHHPPGYIALVCDEVIVREILSTNIETVITVSHKHIYNNSFVIKSSEFKLKDK